MTRRWDPPWYLWRDRPDGRAVPWRVWVLIWVAPVTFLLGALAAGLLERWDQGRAQVVTAQVVQVYNWPGDTPFDFWTEVYSPVFEYLGPDGTTQRVSAGMRHPSLNLALGSAHDILTFPGQDRDAILPGPHNWQHVWVVAALGLLFCLPSFWGTLRVRRWLLQ